MVKILRSVNDLLECTLFGSAAAYMLHALLAFLYSDGLSHSELEVFIEHIPRAERLQGYSAAHRTGTIAYTVFVYDHIQGVGVTAYRI